MHGRHTHRPHEHTCSLCLQSVARIAATLALPSAQHQHRWQCPSTGGTAQLAQLAQHSWHSTAGTAQLAQQCVVPTVLCPSSLCQQSPNSRLPTRIILRNCGDPSSALLLNLVVLAARSGRVVQVSSQLKELNGSTSQAADGFLLAQMGTTRCKTHTGNFYNAGVHSLP